MGSSPSPPPAPDPAATAAAQAKTNKETAITQYGLNATNQITPYGNLSYTQSGTWADGTPKFTATQTLSPEQQALYNTYTANQQALGTLGGQQIGKVSDILNTPYDINASINTQQADIQRKLLDPTWQQREAELQQRLANQGIGLGSAAYTNALRDFGMQRDNSYNAALLASRGQAAQEALTQRNQPLNEITALMSGSQVQQPNFVGTPQTSVAPTDYMGAVNTAYQGALNNYNQQVGQQNAMWGALGSLGGSALGAWGQGGFKKPWG